VSSDCTEQMQRILSDQWCYRLGRPSLCPGVRCAMDCRPLDSLSQSVDFSVWQTVEFSENTGMYSDSVEL
jgi:hypothetical protein